MSALDWKAQCEDYLAARTGRYAWRAVRYRAAWAAMAGLDHSDTLVDVGAGWTELDYCLRAEFGWRGRYVPIDGAIDGTDLEHWRPTATAEWFVGLEIIEHLHAWPLLVAELQMHARKGVVLSTPNPRTTDVLGMDTTHVTSVWPDQLEHLGFVVEERSFYGQPEDSLLAVWTTL